MQANKPSVTSGAATFTGPDGQVKIDQELSVKPGKLQGTGHIIRADGTVEEFTIESDITEAQASSLGLI